MLGRVQISESVICPLLNSTKCCQPQHNSGTVVKAVKTKCVWRPNKRQNWEDHVLLNSYTGYIRYDVNALKNLPEGWRDTDCQIRNMIIIK